jgi:hypothetical protein
MVSAHPPKTPIVCGYRFSSLSLSLSLSLFVSKSKKKGGGVEYVRGCEDEHMKV